MGQIKNIKLHIVTDIKVSLNQHSHHPLAKEDATATWVSILSTTRTRRSTEMLPSPRILPSHPCEIVPFPCSTNGCEVQQSHLETIVYEQDQQTSNLLGSNCSSNESI